MKGPYQQRFVSLIDIWEDNAARFPRIDAVICGDQHLTWSRFNAACNKLSNSLAGIGVGRGDKVAVLMTNSTETLIAIVGIVKSGACVVPLSTMLTSKQLATLLNDSDASLFFVSESLRHLVEPFREASPSITRGWISVGFSARGWRRYEDLVSGAADIRPGTAVCPGDDFIIHYSSGTTGTPKGILHTHASRLSLAHSCAADMRFDHFARALTTTGLYSTGTFLMILPTLLVGGTLIVMEKFSAGAFFATVAHERVSHVFMVPTQYRILLESPLLTEADLSSLICALSAGSTLRRETKAQVIKRISAGLYELYGNTEGIATMLKPEHLEEHLNSVGQPMLGHELKIIDGQDRPVNPGVVGEVVGYSASLMKEYYGKPQETAQALWADAFGRKFIRTGDIGTLDQDYFLSVLDRKKDMIISGGFNVFPIDIEEVISGHEGVFDVTVIGVPHEKWGETPLALVIRRSGAQHAPADILAWANERLARHQRVGAVEFRGEFPRNALGKVMKRQLRAPYWPETSGPAANTAEAT